MADELTNTHLRCSGCGKVGVSICANCAPKYLETPEWEEHGGSPQISKTGPEIERKNARLSQAPSPSEFLPALAAFGTLFHKEIQRGYSDLVHATKAELESAASGETKHAVFFAHFTKLAGVCAAVVNAYFPKLLRVAMAHPERLNERAPLDWTCDRICAEIERFLLGENCTMPLEEDRTMPFDSLDEPADGVSRVVLSAAYILIPVEYRNGEGLLLPWWADTDRLNLYKSPWSVLFGVGNQSFSPYSGDQNECMSESDSLAWLQKRDAELRTYIKNKLSDEYLGAKIDAAGISPQDSTKRVASTVKTRKRLAKKRDFSKYFDAVELTPRQRECLSLKLEYGLAIKTIAEKLQIDRSTVRGHIEAGKRRLDNAIAYEKRKRDRAKESGTDQHPTQEAVGRRNRRK